MKQFSISCECVSLWFKSHHSILFQVVRFFFININSYHITDIYTKINLVERNISLQSVTRKISPTNSTKKSNRIAFCARNVKSTSTPDLNGWTVLIKTQRVICRPWSVRKNCALGLENDPRPQSEGRTEDLGHSFFPIRTDQGWQITYIYFLLGPQLFRKIKIFKILLFYIAHLSIYIIKCALQHFVGDFARLLHAVHNFHEKVQYDIPVPPGQNKW